MAGIEGISGAGMVYQGSVSTAEVKSETQQKQNDTANIEGAAQLARDTVSISTKETELIQKLNQFGAALRQSGTDYNPSGICNYCYELTKEFNQFYHDFTILGEQDETLKLFRLSLAKAVAKVVSLGMGLLGIEMPERM